MGGRKDDEIGAFDALLLLDHPRKAAAAEWASVHLGEHTDEFDAHRWQAAAEFGVQGLTMPPELGGAGATIVEALLTFEGLGLGARDNGMVFALSAQVFSMQSALLAAGSATQHERWIPRLCSGDAIGAFAMSEPDAGSDTASISTLAEPLATGGYRLNGTKTWVTLGSLCDVVIVFATTDPSLGRWGLTAFVLDAHRPEISFGEPIEKLGLESCPFTTMTLTDCVVTDDDVLGNPGAGSSIFADAVNAERAFLYAAQLGATERTINACVERAQTREQFGKRIGQFQAISHTIADMKVNHEAARLLVFKAGLLRDAGADVTMAAALAKLQTSETAVQSALDAVKIFGAEGYTTAAGIEHELRDAIGGLSYSGTSEIQRNIVAGLLRADRPARRRR